MITDRETNHVFFSSWIKELPFYKELCKKLDASAVHHDLLPFTKDYWARDYMPIQITQDKFLQYIYDPDYLREYPQYRTDPTKCCQSLGISTIRSNIVLDGGNIIKCQEAIILTDKIFKENERYYTKMGLINKLENLFQAEIIIIPWDHYEEYGHADGMVRYVRDKCILLNNYKNTNTTLRKLLLKVLGEKFEIMELEYHVTKLSAYNWIYINYLQVGSLILLPLLNIPEDRQVYDLFSRIFSCCRIEPIDISSLVSQGGGLNCVSWNIHK